LTVARLPRPNAGILCLLGGGAVLALHFSLARGSLAQAIVYQAAGILGASTIAVATLIRKPERSRHWWLLAAAVGLWTTGDAIFSAYTFVLHREPPYPSIADWVYLAGYLTMLFAMRALIRSRKRLSLSDLLDSFVIACGSGVIFWVVLIEPVTEGTDASLVGKLVSIAYPTFDLLLLVVLSQLLVTRGRRGYAFAALVAGAALLFAADILYSLGSLSGTYSSGSWIDGGWVLNYALWAAAACHPSMRELHKVAPKSSIPLTWPRLAFVGAASVGVPAAMLYEAPSHPGDLIATAVVSTVILLFVVLRMTQLLREHGRSLSTALEDAEARRKLERQSTERFQAAARVLDCAIYEWTPENGVFWTDGLTTAFGYPLAEVERTRDWWLERVHPDDRAAVETEMTAAMLEGRDGQSEFRWLASDGKYRDVWDRWLTLLNADGTPNRKIGSFVDVTERNRLQDALHQSRKIEAIGKLAGGVAHDFNNLLLSVTVAAELATARAEDDPVLQELLGEISEAADRGASLTQQLLTFSRKQVVEQRVIDVEASVDALVPMLRRLLGADVAVQSDLPADLWKIKADPTQIDQVLVNLCVNARDAMPNGGVVNVSARNVVLLAAAAERLGVEGGEYAAVSVTDSGHGMDAETAARIFEPFFTTKELGKGTGLGLATVYGIATQSGGAIDVETAPGHGTTFTLYLPRTAEELVSEAAPLESEPEPEGQSETILLVEDERSVRTLVRRLLEVEGYIVITADSAEDALVVAGREAGIDLVLTDMVMPGMNGRELMEQLELSRPGMKVVYTSGYFDDRANPTKGAPFLQKPYTNQALARTVREALAS
jgi:signal transduction histidine kinase/CheY-like chemotaxis protein